MSEVDYKIIFTKNAYKDIQGLDKQIATRIHKKFKILLKSKHPLKTAVRLTKPADAQYRWRIGNYRILFDLDTRNNLIIILKIQHRRQIYR